MKFLFAVLLGLLCLASAAGAGRAASDYFQITVVDANTGLDPDVEATP